MSTKRSVAWFGWYCHTCGLVSALILVGGATVARGDLSTGLVAYYPFNGNANDASGNGNNGVVQNSILTADRLGVLNSAYRFNGTNAQITVSDNLALRGLTSSYTLTLWANFSSLPNRDMCFLAKSFGAGGHNKWLFWRHVNSPLGVGLHLNASASYCTNYPLVANRWYMLTFVSSGTTYRIAVNDDVGPALAGSLTLPNTSGVALSIGGPEPSGDQWFNGLLDDVRIYNRALSSAEVQELYAMGGGGVVSAGSSTLSVSPTSVAADGQAAITATATLRDRLNGAVAGKQVAFYCMGSPISVVQPSVPTDANGRCTATLTATTPCAGTVVALDVTDNVVISQTRTVQFTQRSLVLPNADLAASVNVLFMASTNALVAAGGLSSLASISTNLGAYGDLFRTYITEDQVAIALDAVLAFVSVGEDLPDAIKFSKYGLMPGFARTGGSIVTDSPKLSVAFDKQLLAGGEFSSRVLKSVLLQMRNSALEDGVRYVDDRLLDYDLKEYFALVDSADDLGKKTAKHCREFVDVLADTKAQLLMTGIPPMSSSMQTAWAQDLGQRQYVGLAYRDVEGVSGSVVAALEAARNQCPMNTWSWFAFKFGVSSVGTALLDGLGALISNVGFTIGDEMNNFRNLKSDTLAWDRATIGLNSCGLSAEKIHLNTGNAFVQIRQGLAPMTVTGGYGLMEDHEEGYSSSFSIFGSVFTLTNAYSEMEITNSSSGEAAFEVIVESFCDVSAYGISIEYMPQVSYSPAVVIPAGGHSKARVRFYDGRSGGVPDGDVQMQFYVLGRNASGVFYIGGGSHRWGPVGRKSLVGKVENPICRNVVLNPTNQWYEATIFVTNPFTNGYSAIVTQQLPAGVVVLGTDGVLCGGGIVWTNELAAGAVGECWFKFGLVAVPGVATNLAEPFVVFRDQGADESTPFSSVEKPFAGLTPVEVSSVIPAAVPGQDTQMVVAITNWTAITQTGQVSVSILGPGSAVVTNWVSGFAVAGNGQASLSFALPATLAPGDYVVTGALAIGGGSNEVIHAHYNIPVAPLSLSARVGTGGVAGGLELTVHGQRGSNYIVFGSADMIGWSPVQYVALTNWSCEFRDYSVTNSAATFYRAVMP